MLTLDQKLRWSARQLLSHPWITAGDEELAKHDLSSSLSELKRYNARRRLRAAANTVIMTNRISRLTNLSSKAKVESETSIKAIDSAPVIETASDTGNTDYKPPSSVS